MRIPAASYRRWFAALPTSLREAMTAHWGAPPGELSVEGGDIALAGLRLGNLTLMIQPPRGFGENPVAIYHDPDLPPSHHYIAAYHWLRSNVDAVLHLGKHGTLEWLPGKGLGLSAGCAPDAVLGDLPLVYPFIVNDPGEGTQAKRRAHATIVDHLVPPMARADSYGDLAKLEQLLDEYATVQALDPAKLPAVRAQIWTLIQAAQLLGAAVAPVVAVLMFAATEVVPRLAATTDEIASVLHALDGGYVPAGPSGSPTRGLVNVLPTGRNFYSVDPKAIPSRNAWEVGQALADSLLRRHREDTGQWPATVGLTMWGTSAMRTQGDDIAEALALLGCRPVWDDASRRVTGVELVPLPELGRPRVDVTVRISGFFRDAFPHVVALLDDAIALVANAEEAARDNFVRAHAVADVAEHGDWRRATTRIFGSKPGAYGAGLLPLIDARNWRDDRDLAEVYAVWGGYAYGRGLDGKAARADLERVYRRIAVAAKNVDTREHDIADADDYFQYHGGMVAMVRSLTGANPAAYIGDSHRPEAVRTRSLAEETKRVFRARVVNPRWIAAMRRHGYKGAFELAATVDYLFGYDATAGVVEDWMYEQLAQSYVFDAEVRDFLEKSNPWALRGISERLLEAAERGLWAQPDSETLDRLRQAYLASESDLEGRG